MNDITNNRRRRSCGVALSLLLLTTVTTAGASPFNQEEENRTINVEHDDEDETCSEPNDELLEDGTRRVQATLDSGTLIVSFDRSNLEADFESWSVHVVASLAGHTVRSELETFDADAGAGSLMLPEAVSSLYAEAGVSDGWPIDLHVRVVLVDDQGRERSEYAGAPLYVRQTERGTDGYSSLDAFHDSGVSVGRELGEQYADHLAAAGLTPEQVRWVAASASTPDAVIEPLISDRDENEPSVEATKPLPNTSIASDR